MHPTKGRAHIAVGDVNPVSYTHLDVYKRQVLDNAKHYQVLKGLGFHEDLEYCLMKNQLEIAPVFDGNEIRID